MSSGSIIVFEGLDGCGKSTQAARLVQHLKSRGMSVRHLREPGGTPLGEAVRDLLLSRSNELNIGSLAELMLYMASRAQLVEDELDPARAAGDIVVLERSYFSSVAYQGYGLSLGADFVEDLGRRIMGDHVPRRVIVLDIEPREGRQRLGERRDRIESRDLDFFKRVREGFLALAAAHPETFVVLDALRSPDEIEQDVLRELAHVL